jgi:hypothetical protein
MEDVVNYWQGRRILITNCNGFLVRCLAEELLETRAVVTVVLRPRTLSDFGKGNLLEARRRRSSVKRIVIASSHKAYGSWHTLPCSEDYPLTRLHPYDASKSCADILAQRYGAHLSSADRH